MTQQDEMFEDIEDSVMTRTMEGIISFWNQSAEKLYGWRKEDAIGKVSHSLLRTQFPQPLAEIEAELLEKGRWEGKLLHATRDGNRVTVKSRWILNPTGQTAVVVEINARSTDNPMNPEADADNHSVEIDGRAPLPTRRLAKAAWTRWLGLGVLAAATFWICYALLGRLLIHAVYTSDFEIVDSLMAGRAFTPVENYYWHADRLLWSGTIQILAISLLCWLVIRNVAGTFLALLSLVVSSFLAFCIFEMAPSLIRKVHLDVVSPYYAYKANYIYDEELLFREKPFNQSMTFGFKGADYSPIYGIDVPPMTIEWKTDEDGFRNSQTQVATDIVVMGDSYIEYGAHESDTFPGKLQRKLSGVTVTNLGKSGYGPFQYLEVLKRFGLKQKPRYAIFAFYEGNDIHDIRNYLSWKAQKTADMDEMTYVGSQRSLLSRYWVALTTTASHLSKRGLTSVTAALDEYSLGEKFRIHPDLAVLKLADGQPYEIKLADTAARYPGEILQRQNWIALEQILRDFKDVCETHQIKPVVLYIPSASHIYAEFSTEASGAHWLAMRNREIATKKDIENAFTHLAQSVGVESISLSAIFEQRAREGNLLYYRLDPHWNAAGREVAAAFVADLLRARYFSASVNSKSP